MTLDSFKKIDREGLRVNIVNLESQFKNTRDPALGALKTDLSSALNIIESWLKALDKEVEAIWRMG